MREEDPDLVSSVVALGDRMWEAAGRAYKVSLEDKDPEYRVDQRARSETLIYVSHRIWELVGIPPLPDRIRRSNESCEAPRG